MNGINNNGTVGGASKSYYTNTPYGRLLNVTDHVKTSVPAGVDTDSFVKVGSGNDRIKQLVHHEYLRMNAGNPAISGMTEASEEVLSEVDSVIGKFFDGSLSADELQAEYEKLAKQYVSAFEGNNYPTPLPSTQARQAITENFYDNFRQRILHTAVQRNFAEGQTHLTGEMNAQRSWKYYNADYYYESEAAISAATNGAEAVAQEYGLEFEVPDYKAKGLNMYYNFNTAWSNSFDISEKYMIDADMVPPENFEWFFEQGGDSSNRSISPDSLTITHLDGTQTVINYKTDEFDPTDPTKANTWASYTDANGEKHRIGTDFLFNFSESDLRTVAELLNFSTGSAEQDTLLNDFLSNLQVYSKGYFSLFGGNGATGVNFQA